MTGVCLLSGMLMTLAIAAQHGGGDNGARLLEAAYAGDRGTAKRLIERGADVNAHDVRGVTGLYLAAENGHIETVRLLLEHGARVNVISKPDIRTGRLALTPLMTAAMNGHADIVRLLVQHGADMSAEIGEIAPHPCGVTALYLAAVNGHDDVVSVLNQVGTAGEKRWKYLVAAIWILGTIHLMSQRSHATDDGMGAHGRGTPGQ